jgi:hypothetical protein
MLCHAAELCGVSVGWQPFDGGRLALVADSGTSDRAALFAAWQTTTGRAGRWGALLRVGAKVRAHPLDGDFAPHHPDDGKPKVVEPIGPRRPSKRAVIA